MPVNTSTVQFWIRDNTLHIYNPESKTGRIQVFTALGQPVLNAELSRETRQQINLDVVGGYYVVRIIGNDFIENNKNICAEIIW